jgi:hypothetical protein
MLDFFHANGQGQDQGLGSGPVVLYTSDEATFHLSGKINRQNNRYVNLLKCFECLRYSVLREREGLGRVSGG